MIQRFCPALFLFVPQFATPLIGQAAAGRAVTIDDQFAIKDVSDPQISPDGKWVAYVVSQSDLEDDLNQSDVWMTSWDGATTIQLTHTEEGERERSQLESRREIPGIPLRPRG